DTVWVGAQGHAFGPNADRGVYKTTDGGKTWRKVLFRNDSTGISDLVLDPSNSAVLYAAFWQAHRKPWQLVSGGAGGGVFKSSDGGEHWTELTHNTGLPAGLLGNIGLAVSPAKPARIWALIAADSGGVYRSEDGGANLSFNGGKTWSDQDYATAQFYHVTTTNHFPYRVCGAQQDNSGVCGPSRWPGGIDRNQWYDVAGESGHIQARPDEPDITYGG